MLVWHISGLQISLQPFRVCHRQGALFVPMPEPATNLYPGTYPCVQLRALFPGNREKYFYHLFSHLHKKAQRILLCLYISKVWMISLRDCVLCLRIFYNFYFFFCQAIKFIYHLVYCCVCLFYFRFYRNGFLLFLQEIIFPFCLF